MTDAIPRSLGAYRVEERLGMGGMGEVYRAYDEQLDRHVAIKRIRPDIAGDARNRQRFRREARAIAGLNHPAIVKIHHILELDGRDAIVMELVSGSRLADVLKSGPLPVDRARRLAVQIAEGLAAAHRCGVLHRDLKTENVMVTGDGDAKVLDFGLALRFDRADGESITADGSLLGTYRAMSPEQARGLPLDPRSDLFSLGVLLYEMLSGTSPFLADQALETLNRVCTHRQTPLSTRVRETRGPLSTLVDRLLEKDPARRPSSSEDVVQALRECGTATTNSTAAETQFPSQALAPSALPTVEEVPPALPVQAEQPRTSAWGTVVAVVAVLALAFGVLWTRPRTESLETPVDSAHERLYVAVLAPAVDEKDGTEAAPQDEDMLASGLRVALLRTLIGLDGVVTLPSEVVDRISGSPVEVARAVAADEIVASRARCGRSVCEVVLERIASDGRLVWTERYTAPRDRLLAVSESGALHLRDGYSDRAGVANPEIGILAADYRTFLKLRQEVAEGTSNLDRVLDEVERLRVRAPGFSEVYEFESEILRLRYQAQRDPKDLERALEVLGIGRWKFPRDARLLIGEFEILLRQQRLDEAEEVLEQLRIRQPGAGSTWSLEARLDEYRGARADALKAMRRAVELQPSWYLLAVLANMEYRLGEVDAARATVARLLERSPGNYTGLTLGAQIELLAGSPERAAELYGELVERAPRVTELTNLGVALLLLERYAEARERFAQAAGQAPRNPMVILNLADSTLLESGDEAARSLYRTVLELVGDEPPNDWQMLSVQAQALAHLGRRRDAVANAQRILVLASDNAQASYEVALIYTLVGDDSSAMVNVLRAIESGVEPVWFDLPWFAGLRERDDWPAIAN